MKLLKKLLRTNSNNEEINNFIYVAAHEYYKVKNYPQALKLFSSIVTSAIKNKSFSKWSILSQNLILDIFNQQKEYAKIIEQVAKWQDATKGTNNPLVVKEAQDMEKISVEAKFQYAAQTNDLEALQTFYNFCTKNIFAKKSCANAKVLAVKFTDQTKLISLLEKAKDEKALMAEYEIMGRFSDAAKLWEKLELNKKGRKAKYDTFLKIALLYELDQNWNHRDRILRKMMLKVRREKSIPADLENVIFLALDEARPDLQTSRCPCLGPSRKK